MALNVTPLNGDSTFLLSFSATQTSDHSSSLTSTSYLPEPGRFTVLTDPWVTDHGAPQIHHKFAFAKRRTATAIRHLSEIQPPPDVVIVSQDKNDHCHEFTLRQLPSHLPHTIILAHPAAAKKIKSWNYFTAVDKIVALPPYQPRVPKTVIRFAIPGPTKACLPGEATFTLIRTPRDMTALHNAVAITYSPPILVSSHHQEQVSRTIGLGLQDQGLLDDQMYNDNEGSLTPSAPYLQVPEAPLTPPQTPPEQQQPLEGTDYAPPKPSTSTSTPARQFHLRNPSDTLRYSASRSRSKSNPLQPDPPVQQSTSNHSRKTQSDGANAILRTVRSSGNLNTPLPSAGPPPNCPLPALPPLQQPYQAPPQPEPNANHNNDDHSLLQPFQRHHDSESSHTAPSTHVSSVTNRSQATSVTSHTTSTSYLSPVFSNTATDEPAQSPNTPGFSPSSSWLHLQDAEEIPRAGAELRYNSYLQASDETTMNNHSEHPYTQEQYVTHQQPSLHRNIYPSMPNLRNSPPQQHGEFQHPYDHSYHTTTTNLPLASRHQNHKHSQSLTTPTMQSYSPLQQQHQQPHYHTQPNIPLPLISTTHRPKPVSALYAPHGLLTPTTLLQPYLSSHLVPLAALPLTLLLHPFDTIRNPWFLGGVISTGAMGGGVEIAQSTMARCWVRSHDGEKEETGFGVGLMERKPISIGGVEKALGMEGRKMRTKVLDPRVGESIQIRV